MSVPGECGVLLLLREPAFGRLGRVDIFFAVVNQCSSTCVSCNLVPKNKVLFRPYIKDIEA